MKHDWFTDYNTDPNQLPAELAAIEDDDREVFAIIPTAGVAVVISRRPRKATAPEPK